MASLQQEPTGVFHVVVRIEGKRYKRSLKTKVESKAIAKCDEIDENLKLIKRGKVTVPDDVPVIEFLLNSVAVKPPPPPNPPSNSKPKSTDSQTLTLKALFNKFFESIPAGNLEDETLRMMHIHEWHLLRILTPTFNIAALTGQQLRGYVNSRANETSQYFENGSSRNADGDRSRRKISATTIRKEVVTLGAAWRWAKTVPLVAGPFPNRGLRYPKTDEKPPFQTWAEIERQIGIGYLDPNDGDHLWECLYLRKSEVDELLQHVKESASAPFVYPMVTMAAFTGARRSELMRSKRADFDFEQKFVTIREQNGSKDADRHAVSRSRTSCLTSCWIGLRTVIPADQQPLCWQEPVTKNHDRYLQIKRSPIFKIRFAEAGGKRSKDGIVSVTASLEGLSKPLCDGNQAGEVNKALK